MNSPKILYLLEWMITVLFVVIMVILLIGFFWGSGDGRAIAYAAAMGGLGFLACPATPLAKQFSSWQRIGLVIFLSFFL